MSTEVQERSPDSPVAVEQSLEEVLLAILKQYDGLCLDNEKERSFLAATLAAALIPSISEGITQQIPHHPVPGRQTSPRQTGDSFVSPPPAE